MLSELIKIDSGELVEKITKPLFSNQLSTLGICFSTESKFYSFLLVDLLYKCKNDVPSKNMLNKLNLRVFQTHKFRKRENKLDKSILA